jgi:cytochrome P450
MYGYHVAPSTRWRSSTVTETITEPLDYPMRRAAGCPFDPPAGLRTQEPITKVRLWDGSTPWLVTRYADQRALLGDPRVSSDSRRPGYPYQNRSLRARRQQTPSLITMDDPEHRRLRQMVTSPFTIRKMETLRPAVQRIVDDLIDAMLAGPKPVDLVAGFALPVPSLVICALLGVPYQDHDFFQSRSRTLIGTGASVEDVLEAQRELTDYLNRLVDAKLTDPGDDLLSTLAVRRVRTGELTRAELAMMGMLLLVAGHETTANMIALGTLALLEHPEQLAVLRAADDPGVIRGAVEELLRYLTITHSGRRRVALADIEIAGVVIREGDGIVLPNDVGNRDAAAFPHPDRLDVRRDARRHLAFGFGVHQCLGQPLARMELQVAYGTLYRRIPGLRLAANIEDIPFKHDGIVYGVYELPVTW